MNSTCAAILMAGGSGQRLWPLSHAGRAKQFVSLLPDGKTLLGANYAHLRKSLPVTHVFVVCTDIGATHTRALLPKLPDTQIIVVPGDRDTLGTIGYASLAVEQALGSCILWLMASDTWVGDSTALAEAFALASRAAECTDTLVSLGIAPTYPSPLYGYMKRGAPLFPEEPNTAAATVGHGYVEKPSIDVARTLMPNHDWNSGMFAWDSKVFWRALRHLAPDVALAFEQLRAAFALPSSRISAFENLPSISVDHALMERIGTSGSYRHAFVRIESAWDDIGSFEALAKHLYQDGTSSFSGAVAVVECTHTIAIAQEPYTLDVTHTEDIAVAVSECGDILVAKRSASAELRALPLTPMNDAYEIDSDGRWLAAAKLHDAFVQRVRSPGTTAESDMPVRIAFVDAPNVHVALSKRHVYVYGNAGAPVPRRVAPLTVVLDDAQFVHSARCHLIEQLAHALEQRDELRVVMSAGQTPAGLYRDLVAHHHETLPWQRITLLQMDEWCNTHASDSASFAHEMRVFAQDMGMPFRALDSHADNHSLAALDAAIRAEGGIDFVLHGIGENGHLGFNEPHAPQMIWGDAQLTHAPSYRVALDLPTRSAAQNRFGEREVPAHGVTLGLTLLNEARAVLVLAHGPRKADAIAAMLQGPIATTCPASSLRTHPNLRIIVDRAAASSMTSH